MKTHKLKFVHNTKDNFSNNFSLKSFEKAFRNSQDILKNDRNLIKIINIDGIETVVKSFRNPNFIQGVIYKFFRKSKARRSYENSLFLSQKHIQTPEPLGYIEVSDFLRLRESYYISRKLEYDFSLDHATNKYVEDYKNILKSFIKFTHSLHKKNIMHLDYVAGNVCIKKTYKGYDFYLVDLNRLYKGAVNIKKGIKNISRISNNPEIIEILAKEYDKEIESSDSYSFYYLARSVKRNLQRSNLKRLSKAFFGIPPKHLSFYYVWDHYSNQPGTLNNKELKNQISLFAWVPNLKILAATLYALIIFPFLLLNNKKAINKKIDSFGLCVNIDKPVGSQKLISNEELINMIEEISVSNILVRIPLADFDNIDNYINFITLLKSKDILVCILQDRAHIENMQLTNEKLEFIFTKLHNFVDKFQIGNSINRKKWSFTSIDEYFSFFKIAYELKKNKFPKIKLLGSSIIDFDIPFYARSIFHFRSIYYDGIATQLYVDRRGNPEKKQFGFDTLSKIKTYAALAQASTKTSNRLYITEVNWALKNMGIWAPAKNYLTEESFQSRYLVRYFLLMLASGKVEKCYWHQLVAPGYGLINNLDGQIFKRDAYYCYKYLIEILNGGIIKKLIREKNLYCLVVEKGNSIIEAVWSSKEHAFLKSNSNQTIFNMRGDIIETKHSPIINVTGEVIYLKKQKNDYQEIDLKSTGKSA